MTGVAAPRYVPIIKGRRGEFDALRDLQPSTRSRVYPLIEILPSPEEQDLGNDASKAVYSIAERWFAEPVMLDTGYFDVDSTDGQSALGVVMELARPHLKAVPVIRLGDNQRIRTDAAAAAAADGRGAAIRMIGEDLDEDPDDLGEELARVIAEIGVAHDQIDLLFDLGPIQGDVAVVGGSRLIMSLFRSLARLPEYRSITVASGAFPVDLSGAAPWTLGEHARDDAALYNRLLRRPMAHTIDFGDYAIAHPLLVTGVPFSPPPQLRYTVADRWLTLKARRNDPRGNDQFFDVCAVIAQHREFAGSDLGPADRRIAEGKAGGYGPGNATTWRTIGTMHHADLVVSRLTNLGEP